MQLAVVVVYPDGPVAILGQQSIPGGERENAQIDLLHFLAKACILDSNSSSYSPLPHVRVTDAISLASQTRKIPGVKGENGFANMACACGFQASI